MKNKTREVILAVLLLLPIIALSVLHGIRFHETWLFVILTIGRGAFLSLFGAGIVALVLMLFYFLSFHLYKRVCLFLQDDKSLEKLLPAAYRDEMSSVFVMAGFIIAYAYQIYELWSYTFRT